MKTYTTNFPETETEKAHHFYCCCCCVLSEVYNNNVTRNEQKKNFSLSHKLSEGRICGNTVGL